MGYINIYVSKDARISVKNNQLTLEHFTSKSEFPLEDVNCVIIENLQSNISVYTLNALAEYKILTFICDKNHTPSAILLPFCSHYQTLQVYNFQTALKKPIKKQLWKTIVVNKICNQNEVLNICGENEPLKQFYEGVQSGDTTNEEAKASLIYFKLLFGKEFTRRSNNFINAALDYGYSIIRSFIARSIVVHGLTPFLGLFHCNSYNAFNLADDLIEPFRPMVDLFVKTMLNEEFELTSKLKSELLNLVNYDIMIDGVKQTLSNAIDAYVESFVKSIKENNNCLKEIKICGLKIHSYE